MKEFAMIIRLEDVPEVRFSPEEMHAKMAAPGSAKKDKNAA